MPVGAAELAAELVAGRSAAAAVVVAAADAVELQLVAARCVGLGLELEPELELELEPEPEPELATEPVVLGVPAFVRSGEFAAGLVVGGQVGARRAWRRHCSEGTAAGSWPDCHYWEPFHFAAVAASTSDAVEYAVVVGPVAARLAVELRPGLVLVHDAVRRVVDCWLLRIICQRREISRCRMMLTITCSGTRWELE